MARQTLQTGVQPHFTITGAQGNLEVVVGDGREAAIESAAEVQLEQQTGESYTISGTEGQLRLQLPHDASLSVAEHRGDIAVQGIAQVGVETAFGKVVVVAVAGTVTLQDLTGDLEVRDCAALVLKDGPRSYRPGERRGVEDVTVRNVNSVEIQNVGRSLSLHKAQHAALGNIGTQCRIAEVAGDVSVANIGATCEVHGVGGDLVMESVGGACTVEAVAGALLLGNIGGSAALREIGAVERLGNVGGNLKMTAAQLHVAASQTPLHVAVGGSATIELPATVDLSIQAMVGGSVSGPGLALSGPGMHRVVYGAGTAQLHLIAGGNIELRGGGTPRSTGSSWGRWRNIGGELGSTLAAAAASGRSAIAREVGLPDGPPPSAEVDRRTVLQMVAEGRISPADADALLESLSV